MKQPASSQPTHEPNGSARGYIVEWRERHRRSITFHLELPDEPLLVDVVVELVAGVVEGADELAAAAGVAVGALVEDVDSLELVGEVTAGLDAGAELYKSEYQPPPLRIKPPPREI